ncbi:MAG: hypothetical protein K2N12_02495 [Helicobacter sp.]|nr:hypothetical protein [Helicobacter sp.]
MRNILKFGLMSAVAAVALAQTPAAQGMDEDVLAIATRGALSDSMQGFRKLADDEAGSIVGGLAYFSGTGFIMPSGYRGYDVSAYYPILLTASEVNGQRLNIGRGESHEDFYEFALLSSTYGQLFFHIGVNYRTNTVTKQIVDLDERRVNTPFANRMLQFVSSYYNTRFGQDRARYGR